MVDSQQAFTVFPIIFKPSCSFVHIHLHKPTLVPVLFVDWALDPKRSRNNNTDLTSSSTHELCAERCPLDEEYDFSQVHTPERNTHTPFNPFKFPFLEYNEASARVPLYGCSASVAEQATIGRTKYEISALTTRNDIRLELILSFEYKPTSSSSPRLCPSI
ncbi:hypothetical protein ABKN59_009625 [Abortiporus biennis]